jgi:phospholipid/cholesterol/gamma-HCH transport system substrate-binding protein
MSAGLVRTSVAMVVAVAALSGCGYRGAASLPLPGGVGNGGYAVSMVFDDVTNLVPQETCRAGDVVIGSVETITLRDDLKAEVVCRITSDVQLPANAVPTLRETSLLGERFVALDPPPGERPAGVLAKGAALGSSKAHVVPDVEVVLGALSQLLNGGGLDNVTTISRELSTALSGADLGDTTRTVHRLVSTLNDNRSDIVRALEGLDRLSAELEDQREVIGTALDSIPDGLEVLEDERPRLIRTLEDLGELSDETTPFLERTKADTIADFQHLTTILNNLARSKDRLASALESISTFPFPTYSKYVTRYDYAGMFGLYALDLDSFNHLLAQYSPVPLAAGSKAPTKAGSTAVGAPTPPRPVVPVPEIKVPEVVELPGTALKNLLESLPILGGKATASGGAR